MGFFSTLFGSKDMVEKTVSSVISAGDKLFFTEEEKAEYNMEMITQINKAIETARDENSIRSITRRYLALSVIGTALFLTFYSLIFYSVSAAYAWSGGTDISKYAMELLQFWGTPITTIIIFYFGYYAIGNIIKTVKK